jgi:hypothetical protein
VLFAAARFPQGTFGKRTGLGLSDLSRQLFFYVPFQMERKSHRPGFTDKAETTVSGQT